jgi:hypothetical protein
MLINELEEFVAPKLDHQVTLEFANRVVEVKLNAPPTELEAVTSPPGTSFVTKIE